MYMENETSKLKYSTAQQGDISDPWNTAMVATTNCHNSSKI